MHNKLIYILLQQGGEGGGFNTGTLLLIGGIFIVFYFFMLRPQQKKQKDQRRFLEEVKKGDWVISIGGIHGKIINIEDNVLTLEIDKGTKITLEKGSISLEATKRHYQKDDAGKK